MNTREFDERIQEFTSSDAFKSLRDRFNEYLASGKIKLASTNYRPGEWLMTNPKEKYGDVKPQLHLVPPNALVECARVMELGAKKYGPYNWRTDPVKLSVYVSAAKRHIDQAFDGMDRDEESSAMHFAHAMACMAILIDAHHTGNLIDDRPPAGGVHKLMKAKVDPSA